MLEVLVEEMLYKVGLAGEPPGGLAFHLQSVRKLLRRTMLGHFGPTFPFAALSRCFRLIQAAQV